MLPSLKKARQPLRDVSRSPRQEVGRPCKNFRTPLKETRPSILEDRKAKVKRARSPFLTSSPIPQLDGTNLLSRTEDTEESDSENAPEPGPGPESAPEPEPETESAPEPEPETEAGPESETELEIELKPPVNIANPVFSFCEEKAFTVCQVRHNVLAYEKVDNQIKHDLVKNYRKFCCFSAMDDEGVSCEILHWHSKSNLCLSYESFSNIENK